MDIELRHKLFLILSKHPEITQRNLSQQLGVSLGKTNYCLRALMQKGWVKAQNFKTNKNKKAYTYYLTKAGLEEKARLAIQFLRKKQEEYEVLKEAIEELEKELAERTNYSLGHGEAETNYGVHVSLQ